MHYNILLLILDCVRHDQLGSAGCEAVRTPTIDMIAKEGVRFKQAICHAPFTTPSIASIVTGLNPCNHGVRLLVGQQLSPAVVTLAELLRDGGYRNAAFPSIFMLERSSGLARGFHYYDDQIETIRKGFRGPWRPGNITTERVLSFLKNDVTTTPFFCCIHYFDAHDYDLGHADSLVDYQQRIGEVDSCIASVVAALQEINAWDNTIVVVTSDHGDGFGEHGLYGHGKSLYDEVLRVPLIIRAPDMIPAGLTVEQQVRHIDIVPTLLDLVGMYQEKRERGISLDGVSLVPSLEGRDLGLSAYAETSPLQLFTGDLLKTKTFQGPEMMCLRTVEKKYLYKSEQFDYDRYARLIRKEKENTYVRFFKSVLTRLHSVDYFPHEELYDLKTDPREIHNRAARDKGVCKDMRQQLTDLLDRASRTQGSTTADWSPEEEEAIREKLQTIGYLE